jgi:pentalenene oxygenase
VAGVLPFLEDSENQMAHSPTTRSFFRDPVAYVRTHGGETPVLPFTSGPSSFVLLRDPEAIWRVLVTDVRSFRPGKWKRRARRYLGDTLNTLDGEEHRQRRLLLQPALDRRRIASFVPLITLRAERAQGGWKDGDRLLLRDELERLALVVAGDLLLSRDLEPDAPELATALSDLMSRIPRFVPPVHGTVQARAVARVDRLVGSVIAERTRSPRNGDDLVGRLIGSGLPERTMRGELIAFLLAAVDEPPSALEAAWYLLGRHPNEEKRLHSELDSTSMDDAKKDLSYLDAVLRETLRLFPPARHIDRCPVRDVTIDGTRIRAGSNVIVSPLVTHQEPTLYDRASDFLPERWLGATQNAPSRGAYMPFGVGAHTCIGEALAQAIMTVTLATIGRRWRLRVDPNAPPPAPRRPRLMVTLEQR